MQVCKRWNYVLQRSEALWRTTDLEAQHKAVTDDVLKTLLEKYVCVAIVRMIFVIRVQSFVLTLHIFRHGQWMQSLGLKSCWRVTDTGLGYIAQYAAHLLELSLYSCWYVVPSALISFVYFFFSVGVFI